MRQKAIVAMSGGVDSSVAAYLMIKEGYDCTGATMKLFFNEDLGIPEEQSCCSAEDIKDAQEVCDRLGIPHHVFDFSDRFRECVIDRFISAYENGRTPNPCIDCNRYLKFGRLYSQADELGCDVVATGHYARIEFDGATGRYLLKKALNPEKDQSYVLYNLTQQQLKRTVFPLGNMTKEDARRIAREQNFQNAHKHESQDICFVKQENYADFIRRQTGKTYPEGDFTDLEGNFLGKHRGIINYTVGQRKGLGLSFAQPMYVCAVNPDINTVTLGTDRQLFSSSLTATGINLISTAEIKSPLHLKAKIRYRQPEQWATVTQTGPDELHLEFDLPQRAITKGQAVVLYDEDVVVGGGTISEAK